MSFAITPRVLFDPTGIPGCCLWLDAADTSTLTTSGANVQQWRDKSGNANHASNTTAYPTLSNSAQNGRSVVSFNGSQYLTLSTSSLPTGSTQCSFYFVTRTTTSGVQVFFTYGADPQATNQNPQFYYTSGLQNVDTYGSSGLSDTTNVQNAYTILSATFTNSNVAWTNGTLFTGGSTAVSLNTGTGWASIGVGRVVSALNYYFTGQIAEILIYNRPATTLQRQQIEGYLAWKWGIQPVLDGAHPYKTIPAYAAQPFPLTQGPVAAVPTSIFTPTSISGCQLWLDGADRSTFTLSGTNISQWADKSGNAYHLTQDTTSKQPAYTVNDRGLGGLLQAEGRWVGRAGTNMPLYAYGTETSGMFVVRNASTNTSWNIFATMFFNLAGTAQTTKSRWHFSMNYGSTNGLTLIVGNTPQTVYQNTSFIVPVNSTVIVGFTISPSAVTINYNGSNASYAGYTMSNADDGIAMILADSRASTPVSNTVIFEMIGYNQVISSSQRQQMEGYLAWKWGLQSDLPSNHPYKNNPLFALPPFPNPTSIPRTLSPILFSPLQFTPQLWLDASDRSSLTFSGSNVTQWRDKSSNVYTFSNSGTIGTTTLNSLNVLTMGVGQEMLTSSFPWRTKCTQFFVLSGNSGFLFSSWASTNYRNLMYTGNGPFYLIGGGFGAYLSNTTGVLHTQNSYYILTSGYNNGSSITPFAQNGSNRTGVLYSGSPQGDTTYTDPLYINGNADTTTWGSNNVAEILHYNDNLTATQCRQIEGYLAWKWGLQANLPASHPFKSLPPL